MHTIGSHFNAHDAYADVKALSDVFKRSSYSEGLIAHAKTGSKTASNNSTAREG